MKLAMNFFGSVVTNLGPYQVLRIKVDANLHATPKDSTKRPRIRMTCLSHKNDQGGDLRHYFSQWGDYVRVEEVPAGSLAHRAGVEVGDILCEPAVTNADCWRLLSKDDYLKITEELLTNRKCLFYVARKASASSPPKIKKRSEVSLQRDPRPPKKRFGTKDHHKAIDTEKSYKDDERVIDAIGQHHRSDGTKTMVPKGRKTKPPIFKEAIQVYAPFWKNLSEAARDGIRKQLQSEFSFTYPNGSLLSEADCMKKIDGHMYAVANTVCRCCHAAEPDGVSSGQQYFDTENGPSVLPGFQGTTKEAGEIVERYKLTTKDSERIKPDVPANQQGVLFNTVKRLEANYHAKLNENKNLRAEHDRLSAEMNSRTQRSTNS